MGHAQKTHAEFYRLPQDIYQTAKVAKILILLEKGKGHQFKGKSLDEIVLDEELTSDSDDEESNTVRTEERLRETQKQTEPNSVTVSSEREIPPEHSRESSRLQLSTFKLSLLVGYSVCCLLSTTIKLV
ncbi:hypothetical protein HHI36_004902 [Cryptolaemus montrouzieri]|uniref:Uncharacterized protein n=1 Tax=Cryptolaemus montrouzieri TaxID=559131 RepID=A0ABD2NTI4_9CUCU